MITAVGVDAEQELASLCGVLNASYARLVAIVADALEDESWAIAGVRSPEHWLTMRAGLSPFRARQVVAVARRFGELPTVMEEFADGQLSLDQVMVVTRYAPTHVEASAAELAVHASVPQLRRALSRYSFDPPAQPGHAEPNGSGHTTAADNTADVPPTWNGYALVEDRATAPAELSMSHDEWGRFTLRFSAPADLGALVEAALGEAKDALFKAGRPQVGMGDAMIEIAQRSLGAVASINRRDAYRTYVHLDTEGGWLTGKPRLPQHITKKLTCDGILQPIWRTQGAPVNVGRAQRIVPARTRRLVEDRDRGCRFPGCAATAYVECHHLIHWVDGGPTDTPNLCSLCPFHHDGHHDREFTIAGNADDPDGLSFTTKSGSPIRSGPTFTTPSHQATTSASASASAPPWAPQAPPGSPPATPYRGPSGETLSLRWVTFAEPRTPVLA
ncbi:MAG: DUF222 domain-containing protein [Actinomycetota bacterium]